MSNPYCKSLFKIPPHKHYFCGHSLGPQSLAAFEMVSTGLSEWENNMVSAWTDWIHLPKYCAKKIAPLIGAKENEVIVCDNTTINLLKLLLSAISLQSTRKVILTEEGNFPTDNYMAQSVAQLQNMTLKVVPADKIMASLDENVAVLLLTHVNYRTAKKWDMAKLIQSAKVKGILTIWDLSHSVGIMPLACSTLEVDFAVGCTYKYLNGGPGAPSFIYVNQKHHNVDTAIQGWIGHCSPFSFSSDYVPAQGVARFQSGTPSILSMKALLGALTLFETVDLHLVEKTSHALSTYFIEQCAKHAPSLQCLSPLDATQRGGHVAFYHPLSEKLACALLEQGIIPDYRAPGLIRFGLSPLYNNQHDIDEAVNALKCLL